MVVNDPYTNPMGKRHKFSDGKYKYEMFIGGISFSGQTYLKDYNPKTGEKILADQISGSAGIKVGRLTDIPTYWVQNSNFSHPHAKDFFNVDLNKHLSEETKLLLMTAYRAVEKELKEQIRVTTEDASNI